MKITLPDNLDTNLLNLMLLSIAQRELDLQYDYIIPVYQNDILIGNIIITGGTK